MKLFSTQKLSVNIPTASLGYIDIKISCCRQESCDSQGEIK